MRISRTGNQAYMLWCSSPTEHCANEVEGKAIVPYGVQTLGWLAAAAMFGWLLLAVDGVAFWATLCGVLVSVIWAFDGLLGTIQQLKGMKSTGLSTKEM